MYVYLPAYVRLSDCTCKQHGAYGASCLGNGIAHSRLGLHLSVTLGQSLTCKPTDQLHAENPPLRLFSQVILGTVKLTVKANCHTELAGVTAGWSFSWHLLGK